MLQILYGLLAIWALQVVGILAVVAVVLLKRRSRTDPAFDESGDAEVPAVGIPAAAAGKTA